MQLCWRRCVVPRYSTDRYRRLTFIEQTIKQGFEASGFTPTVQPLKEFEDDYGLKVGDEEEDEDDDDDDDDDEDSETGSEGSEDERDE